MNLILMIVSVVSLVVFLTFKASEAEQAKAVPEQLDLDSVRDALMEKLGWSRERADGARVEYLRFLTLLKKKPGFMVVPWANAEGQDDLDQFWHQHILDTAKYEADCKRLFGRMIHHNPHVVRGSREESNSVEKTRRLYGRTFGSDTDGGEVTAIFLSSCSTCAAGDGHGSSDGGHGDGGGHGCGGHGCGGSGCGGH